MAFDRTNKGSLGKNKKPQSEKSPNYTGQINVEGKDYWLNAWVKTNGDTGEKFFSLSLKPKDSKPSSKSFDPDFNDDLGDIPF